MDVVGIGFPCIDFLINVDRFPVPNSYAMLQDFSWQGGGKVSTALVALGRLGIKTRLIAAMGDDVFAKFLIADFRRHGVDTSKLKIDPEGTTTLSVPLSDTQTGSRSFLCSSSTCKK
jgi:sugar/nucleoside kinase (ribokinase family)